MARSLPASQRVVGTLHDLSRAARRHARRRVRRTVHAVRPPAAVGAYVASHPVARLNVGVGGGWTAG